MSGYSNTINLFHLFLRSDFLTSNIVTSKLLLLLDHARKRIEMRQHVDQTAAIILTFENILLITYNIAFYPWYSLRNGVLCICTEMDTFFDSQFTFIPYLWLMAS